MLFRSCKEIGERAVCESLFHIKIYICLDHQEQSSSAFPVTEVGAGVGASLIVIVVFFIVAFVLIRYSHRFYNVNFFLHIYMSVIELQIKIACPILTVK